jgi:Ca-activated chloride channel family protein
VSNLEFDDRWLLLLWAIPVVAAAGVYGVWQRRRALQRFASWNLLGHLAPPLSWGRPLARLLLIVLCLTALVAAIINPRWGEREQQVVRRNIDLMVLLDVSRSMLARDIAPNRLERAKVSIRDDLLPALGGDRIGMIAFAGAATLVCPLTNDYGFFRLALDDVSPDVVPRGGTFIGDAIRRAVACFPEKLNTNKVILLITDGEDHGSLPVEAAGVAWEEQRVPVVALALGDEREGARIPIRTGRGEAYLEHKEEVVWTRANFDQLRAVAAVSSSAFIPAGTANFDLGDIYRRVIVPRIEHEEQIKQETVPRPSRYHPFALAALVLLLLDSLLPEGRGRVGAVAAGRSGKEAA